MFKNLGKVFRFTFRHQTESKGYKILTIIIALVLFAAPLLVLVIGDKVSSKGKKELKPCDADRVIIATDLTDLDQFSMLAFVAEEPSYANIKFERMNSVTEALNDVKAKGEKNTLVVEAIRPDKRVEYTIIVPEGSDITEKKAKNLDKFISKNDMVFAMLCSGLDLEKSMDLGLDTEQDVFDTDGYASRSSLLADSDAKIQKKNEDILSVFRMIVTYFSMFIIYFVVLTYGVTIMNVVVMEKSSKLMDTMLISVAPEAMVFGKMLGVLLAAVIQLAAWGISIILGFVVGYQIVGHTNPDSSFSVYRFLKSIGDMGAFTPGRLAIAVLILCLSIVLFASLATIGGAIASTKEEAASNQGLFTIVTVIAFLVVMAKGMGDVMPTWICLIPFTGAMALPGAASSGSASIGVSLLGLFIMVACTLLFIYVAGKCYKMMSLYKGNKVSYTKAMKMLLNMNDEKKKAD